MKKSTIKLISALLSIFMLATVFISCDDKKGSYDATGNRNSEQQESNPTTDNNDTNKDNNQNNSKNEIGELEYKSINGGTEYEVISKGSFNGSELIIPDTHNGRPVTSIGERAFSGCDNITSITIPDSVKSIGENGAFYSCQKLKSLTLGNSVESIGAQSFENCFSLEKIIIPDSVKTIGVSAFQSCFNLKTVTLGNSIELIDNSVFFSCYALTSIVIPDSVKRIGDSAFSNCRSIFSAEIGNGVESIGKHAFSGCYNLTSVKIGERVTSIGEYAFDFCNKLIEIYNASALNITAGSSSNGGIAANALNIYIPSSGASRLHTIDSGYVFYVNGSEVYLVGYLGEDTDLVFPDNYYNKSYEIYKSAFRNNEKITSVTIGSNVTIGDNVFAWCENLTSATVNSAVIKEGAFKGCHKLTKIILDKTVESIIGHSIFNGCTNLIIYAKAASKPSGWSDTWNACYVTSDVFCPVVWGYTGE